MNFTKNLFTKIKDHKSIESQLAVWRFLSKKIVFTNGCFDLLHPGHLQYLAEARALGDILIIGLNSDASVKRLKGEHRPINDEKARGLMLAALVVVDAVIVFDEDTPLQLLQLIRPEVLVKGGDYSIETIVGATEILNNGGQVHVLSFMEGYSTTAIEQRIRNSA